MVLKLISNIFLTILVFNLFYIFVFIEFYLLFRRTKRSAPKGIKEVAGIGIASVTHKITVNKVIAAVQATALVWLKIVSKTIAVSIVIRNALPKIIICLLVISFYFLLSAYDTKSTKTNIAV